jgi:heme-degrading monooxygenase HmoA
MMERLYTHTTWQVKAGQEDEFVRRWSEWADWSHEQGLNAAAVLLRDVERAQTFISFGPWESMAAVRSWRSLTGYQERVARLSEVVDSFEPRTLEELPRR